MNGTAALPAWRQVLAVVAHPDDESFGLGAVLDAFAASGAAVTVLCLTHGEASTLHGVSGDLAALRQRELSAAATALGLTGVTLRAYPDGRLEEEDLGGLVGEVRRAVATARPQGIVAFDIDGVTGHSDHARATAAAVSAAEQLHVPVLGWTIPVSVAGELNAEFGTAFTGHPPADIDVVLTVDRTRQRHAVACHATQALPGSVLWRRLELLGDHEYLRWLTDPVPAASARSGQQHAP